MECDIDLKRGGSVRVEYYVDSDKELNLEKVQEICKHTGGLGMIHLDANHDNLGEEEKSEIYAGCWESYGADMDEAMMERAAEDRAFERV